PPFVMSESALAFLRFRRALADARFVALFEQIGGAGLERLHVNFNRMVEGDFLRRHEDEVGDRRFAFSLYLSEGWLPACGGVLTIVARDGREWMVPPEYNTAVVFDLRAQAAHWI